MEKNIRSPKILAIDPGTKEMGMAVLDENELLDYGVKTLRRGPNGDKDILNQVEKIITRLITQNKPDVLVIEKNLFSHIKQNYLLTMVVATIRNTAKRLKIKVKEYAPNTIRKQVCGDGYATKREVARAIALKFPELKVYLDPGKKWKERYWQNIFDAVAVGLTYLKSLNGQSSNK